MVFQGVLLARSGYAVSVIPLSYSREIDHKVLDSIHLLQAYPRTSPGIVRRRWVCGSRIKFRCVSIVTSKLFALTLPSGGVMYPMMLQRLFAEVGFAGAFASPGLSVE